MVNLTPQEQKQAFKRLFPQFTEYFTPFCYGTGELNRAVVETWGSGDHLVLLLHQEEYLPTASRYTPETASRKYNIEEAIQYTFPSATKEEVKQIINEFIAHYTDSIQTSNTIELTIDTINLSTR